MHVPVDPQCRSPTQVRQIGRVDWTELAGITRTKLRRNALYRWTVMSDNNRSVQIALCQFAFQPRTTGQVTADRRLGG